MTVKYTRLSIRKITHTRAKAETAPFFIFRASHLGFIPSKDCVAAWALMSDVLEIVHAEGNTHAAPETKSTHDSRSNPCNNANLLECRCSNLGPAVGALHVYWGWSKHPGSYILVLHNYGSRTLSVPWLWRRVVLISLTRIPLG